MALLLLVLILALVPCFNAFVSDLSYGLLLEKEKKKKRQTRLDHIGWHEVESDYYHIASIQWIALPTTRLPIPIKLNPLLK